MQNVIIGYDTSLYSGSNFCGLQLWQGDGVGLSPVSTGRVRYNTTAGRMEFSENGSPYFSFTGLGGGVLSVMDYGAVGGGLVDDTAAWLAVIAAAKAIGRRITVTGEERSFLISSMLRVDFNNFGIKDATLITDEPAADAFIPLLVMKEGITPNNPVPVYGFTAENVEIRYLRAGQNDATAIQLNSVHDFHVHRCRVYGDGAGMAGCRTSGLGCAMGSSDGVFEDCTVDGISKGAVYLAGCDHIEVRKCVGRNGYESVNPYTGGLQISAAEDCLINGCDFHNNRGDGLYVQPVQPLSVDLSTLHSQTSIHITSVAPIGEWALQALAVFDTVNKVYEMLDILSLTPVGLSGLEWQVELNAGPAFPLALHATLYANFRPPTRITVKATSCVDNIPVGGLAGRQFLVASGYPGCAPSAIQFDACTAKCTSTGWGYVTQVCQGVRYDNCRSYGGVVGVCAQDAKGSYPDGSNAENLCNDVVVTGGSYEDAVSANIWLDSANDVILEHPRVVHHSGMPGFGIQVNAETVWTVNKPCRNVQILDPEFFGYASMAAALNVPAATDRPASGAPGDSTGRSHYRLRFPGTPIAQSVQAPPGSLYTDTTSPSVGTYVKMSGDDATGWGRQLTDVDLFFALPHYAKATLLGGTPSAAVAGRLVWCTDDVTGAQVACSGGGGAGDWHRGINATNALIS